MEPASLQDPILERIPHPLLTPRQWNLRPIRPSGLYHIPICRFLREPRSLDELNLPRYRAHSLWRDNGTLFNVSDMHFERDERRTLSFNLISSTYELNCCIFGETDEAIAETATFFCSLHDSNASHTRLEIYAACVERKYAFDFSCFRPEQLAQIMNSNPTRHFDIRLGTWTPEQIVIFTTRPYPLNLTLAKSEETSHGPVLFPDGGSAFVDALEKRQAFFGSLAVDFPRAQRPFSCNSLKRLLRLEIFETLAMSALEQEMVLLPFSAKVDALQYDIDAKYIRSQDFHSLNIATNDLNLKLYLKDYHENWDGLLISFLNRVSELGHFKRLGLSMNYRWNFEDGDEPFFEENNYPFGRVKAFVDAVIRAFHANPSLQCLDLSEMSWKVDLDPHIQPLFQALEGHPSMRTLLVRDAKYIRSRDFHSLNIATDDLTLKLHLEDYNERWDGLLSSFSNRVAALGHFKRLELSMSYRWKFANGSKSVSEEDDYPFGQVKAFADALTRAICANPLLQCLDLSEMNWKVDLCPHMQPLFKALEGHPSMRTLVVREYPPHDKMLPKEERQRYYLWLDKLLSRNENITVYDMYGSRCSNGSSICDIYEQRFHCGSTSLVTECASVRPVFVATALVQRASKNFKLISHLLLDHTDMLCELVRPERSNLIDLASKPKDWTQSLRAVKQRLLEIRRFSNSDHTDMLCDLVRGVVQEDEHKKLHSVPTNNMVSVSTRSERSNQANLAAKPKLRIQPPRAVKQRLLERGRFSKSNNLL